MGDRTAAFHGSAFGVAKHFEIIVIAQQGAGRCLGLLELLQNFLHVDDPVSGGMDKGTVDSAGFLTGMDSEIVKKPPAESFVNCGCILRMVSGSQTLHQQLTGRFGIGFCIKTPAADYCSFVILLIPV